MCKELSAIHLLGQADVCFGHRPAISCDVERFCTGTSSSVLSIDRTFNLGPFVSHQRPTTIYLLRQQEVTILHILLGTILIKKHSYYLVSTLIRLNRLELKAYGTDGEPELIKAFGIYFPEAIHLRCTNHHDETSKKKITVT